MRGTSRYNTQDRRRRDTRGVGNNPGPGVTVVMEELGHTPASVALCLVPAYVLLSSPLVANLTEDSDSCVTPTC